MNNLVKATETNIRKAASIIKDGGIVAFPTETVYGLGANGFDSIAVAKIFEAKNRPSFNPLILHICSVNQLNEIAYAEDPAIKKLVNKFWPGPLTLVLKKKEKVPAIVTAGSSTVAVRMPMNKIALQLIEFSGVPIAAPSANKFSAISPTTAKHVAKQLGKKVDLILDGGPTKIGIESTIVKFEDNEWQLLRYGGLPTEEIEQYTGKLIIKGKIGKPEAPGQLPFHYAPAKPVKFIDETSPEELLNKKIACLFFSRKNKNLRCNYSKVLSPNNNLAEAAANLFSFLYELEALEVDLILVEKPPLNGLGLAIMDRLQKAVNKYSAKL